MHMLKLGQEKNATNHFPNFKFVAKLLLGQCNQSMDPLDANSLDL